MKGLIDHLSVVVIGLYLLPFVIQDLGSAMLVLLILEPLLCFLVALSFGIRYSFNIFLPILVGLFFLPSIFIFYNSSAWVYGPFYALLSLLGNATGALIHRHKKAND